MATEPMTRLRLDSMKRIHEWASWKTLNSVVDECVAEIERCWQSLSDYATKLDAQQARIAELESGLIIEATKTLRGEKHIRDQCDRIAELESQLTQEKQHGESEAALLRGRIQQLEAALEQTSHLWEGAEKRVNDLECEAALGEPVAWIDNRNPERCFFRWHPDDVAIFDVSTIIAATMGIPAGECRGIHVGKPLPKPAPTLEPKYRDDVLTVYSANGRTGFAQAAGETENWFCEQGRAGSCMRYPTREAAEAAAIKYCLEGT